MAAANSGSVGRGRAFVSVAPVSAGNERKREVVSKTAASLKPLAVAPQELRVARAVRFSRAVA